MKPRFRIHWNGYHHIPDTCEYAHFDVDLEPLNKAAEDICDNHWSTYYMYIES